jgi:hypothetical protein
MSDSPPNNNELNNNNNKSSKKNDLPKDRHSVSKRLVISIKCDSLFNGF